MNRLLWFFWGLTLASQGWAQERPPRKGDTYQVQRVDLNGDGRPEKVGLKCVEVNDSGWYSRLTVWNSAGAVQWQSMPSKVGVWAFGGWDWGISDLQLVADINGDGKVEALVPEPVSDVSPVTFRVFRWSGKAFQHVKNGSLIAVGQNEFQWSSEASGKCWIGKFKAGPLAVVWRTSDDGQVRLQTGAVQGNAQGFKVLRWLPGEP